MFRDVVFIGSASGWGAPDKRCGDGPVALVNKGLLPCFQYLDHLVCPAITMLQPLDKASHDKFHIVSDICTQLSNEVTRTLEAKHFPIVLGGDHSCAIGTWSGVHRVTKKQGDIGLIWIDAHMDSHTPLTSHSGELHGMPVATLLGYGDRYLTHLGDDHQNIKPEHLCLLGIRSYEQEEKDLLDSLGVRVITMDEINRIGFEAAWQQAIKVVSRGTVGFGVSIDIDAIDPREAPGVGSPEANGICADALLKSLRNLHDNAALLTLEISEYNPYRDHNDATAALMAEMITAVLSEEEQQ